MTAGKIRDQIEKPEALKTLNSLFLLSFIYVFIELNKKTVGRIIGRRVGICRIAIFSKTVISIFLLELLLMSSIKSIEIKNRQANKNIIKKEKRFSLIKYLKTSVLLKIIFSLISLKKMELT